ncbi:hypothetical protein BGW80DRAFT_1465225 [Lactifluus volemus]|nr:hypothetical protein BGW80DRAFT_1465225 [Lactifluus volemus]
MFMNLKTILALSFAALAIAAPSPQGGLGADLNQLLDNLGVTVDDLLSGQWVDLLYISN